MKYLLFDECAISILIGSHFFQSVEYSNGMHLIKHTCGELESEVMGDIWVQYETDGIIFYGKKNENASSGDKGYKVFCIDLTQCRILNEKEKPEDMLTVLQKAFRVAIKTWNMQPFSSSERVNGSKSIVFPFVMTDRRRIVIERTNNVPRLKKRGIIQPLLAYKYNAEEYVCDDDFIDVSVLEKAGEAYVDNYYSVQNKLKSIVSVEDLNEYPQALRQLTTKKQMGEEGFIFLNYETQYANLTKTQKKVVDYGPITSPLRVDGAAGTGKTVSLIMRAYRLLVEHKKNNKKFKMIFLSHSESTNRRNTDMFLLYQEGEYFLSEQAEQSIKFSTLLEFCRNYTKFSTDKLTDLDAGEAKTYQLMLIEHIIEKANNENIIRTYKPLISQELSEVFDREKTPLNTACALLQHEFSIQIKGRTNCTIDNYYEIEAIDNALPCKTKEDKELVFLLFNMYQEELKSSGQYDVDDVVMEALSRFDAPIWRRERSERGYDYILVDEMHLFNINEQSVFHFLPKSSTGKDIPICFALDYSQAVGDRGNIRNDYIEKLFGEKIERQKYKTVFRNSPDIANFCASVAAAGTLMFQNAFVNPYDSIQSSFTDEDERKSERPRLHMYINDDEMLKSLEQHINTVQKELNCKPNEIAVISFDYKLTTPEGAEKLSKSLNKKFKLLEANQYCRTDDYILTSPHNVNGLEFQAVILYGVDEGRIPQTAGTSDVSNHFIRYSAYNLLYLAASRAKYRLIVLGSTVNGVSSCLEHSIEAEAIDS